MSNDFEMPQSTTSLEKEDVKNNEKIIDKNKEEPIKYSQEELLRIFDEIVFAGTYTELVSIKGRLKIGLRTRTAEEIDIITMKIDSASANLISTVNEKRSLLNLHYALTSYQGKDLTTIKTEDRISFINKLPAPVIGALMREMAKFDTKVYAACSEGEENF